MFHSHLYFIFFAEAGYHQHVDNSIVNRQVRRLIRKGRKERVGYNFELNFFLTQLN